MPLILPHRDAVTFLLERRAALDAPPPMEQADQTDQKHEASP
jgi:hypothetical protein